MEFDKNHARLLLLAAIAAIGALLLVRIASFGIWDPWELNAADEARHLLAGEEFERGRAILPSWLASLSFGVFGVREWAGRLPFALSGLLSVGLAYLLVARFAGRRAGVFAALVVGTSPLFLFNSRQMIGDSPAFAASAIVALGAAFAVFRPTVAADVSEKRRLVAVGIWLGVAVLGVALAILARGALLAALPPLAGVAVAAAACGYVRRPDRKDLPATIGAWGVTALAVIVGALVARAVVADVADLTPWIGGRPRGGNPPSFDKSVEALFHAFAPWSALLPVALARLLVGPSKPAAPAAAEEKPADDDRATPEAAFRLALLCWAVAAWGALTLYTARYGPGAYTAVVAFAGAVAILLRDAEDTTEPWWAVAVIAILLVGLVIRDYGLYPGGPIAGLGITDVTVPDVFNPKTAWAIVLGLFGLTAAIGLVAAPRPDAKIDPRAPYRWLRDQWRRGLSFKIWLAAAGVLLVVVLLFGVTMLVAGDSLPLTSLVVKWGGRLVALPLGLPLAVLGVQALLFAMARFGKWRFVPLFVAALGVAGYASQGFLPALSSHFSPREVYDTFNALADDEAVLGEYRVGGRAAAYYARGEVRDIADQNALVDFLVEEERRWAAFPADELPAIDRAYRRRTNDHLFVADARSARVVLATNQPVEGRENENFVAKYVLDEPPEVQHRVNARFEDKIELIGYSLDLPHEGYVGPGESFTVTWYWRALKIIPGSWKVFLHVDGQGNRLNGDHDPVDGKYPVRLWDEGDIVVDVQELSVPANYRPGPYTFFIGFYAGEGRLTIEEGPKDTENRVRAGTVLVR